MKYFLFLILFVPMMAFGNPLDNTLKDLNDQLNPKVEGTTGWALDYREEDESGQPYLWINIMRVERVCSVGKTYIIQNDSLVAPKERTCAFRASDALEGSLMQIICKSGSRESCTKSLSKNVTLSIINQMIRNRIFDAEVK